MNERIKALAVEADFALYEDGNFRSDPGQWINAELEKFAKLIIQDCISQTALVGIGNFNNLDIVWAVDAAIDNIQRHFGILPE
jgi:hypothetical protein